jgi:16S rRNA A1518/A1519 N6-dimethyltransferase RsmA/KsgA/DIM1 with predicted DNA glycosylase/AP lyase activity
MAIDEDPEGHEIAALATMVPTFASRHVLEIGCGSGRLTARYAHQAASVVAIDPDADDIAELSAALPGVDARAIGIDELTLPPHSVDIVLFAWSL